MFDSGTCIQCHRLLRDWQDAAHQYSALTIDAATALDESKLNVYKGLEGAMETASVRSHDAMVLYLSHRASPHAQALSA
ncbi:MAG: hypothetical protein JWN34_5045 [Bryobacterales bacterium]|nr:hypothetical protein [Bryobacterales bacterium]